MRTTLKEDREIWTIRQKQGSYIPEKAVPENWDLLVGLNGGPEENLSYLTILTNQGPEKDSWKTREEKGRL